MFKKYLSAILITMVLTGCSTWHDLKAPCTYNSRSGCGPVIPMQQTNQVD